MKPKDDNVVAKTDKPSTTTETSRKQKQETLLGNELEEEIPLFQQAQHNVKTTVVVDSNNNYNIHEEEQRVTKEAQRQQRNQGEEEEQQQQQQQQQTLIERHEDKSDNNNSNNNNCNSNDNNDAYDDEWMQRNVLNTLKEKLYLREREERILLDAYHSCVIHNDAQITIPSGDNKNHNDSKNNDNKNKNKNKMDGEADCCQPIDFILISGPTGVGKTRLAFSLEQHIQKQKQKQKQNQRPRKETNHHHHHHRGGEKMSDDGGYFLTIKFDPYLKERREAFTAFKAGFTDFTNQIIQRGEKAVQKACDAIHQAGIEEDHQQLLLQMIPALCQILKKKRNHKEKEEVTTMGCGAIAMARLSATFRMFLSALASPDQPIVLLFDDLQWADPCSFRLVQVLITDAKTIDGLVVIGTLDPRHDNDIDVGMTKQQDEKYCGPLCSLLQRTMGDDIKFCTISLNNLTQQQIHAWMVDSLPQLLSLHDDEKFTSLSSLIYHKTNGNHFYVFQFLLWLAEEHLFSYDRVLHSLEWDEQQICRFINQSNTNHPRHEEEEEEDFRNFLVKKLQRLPMDMKEVLMVAACLGSPSKVDPSLLEWIELSASSNSVESVLKDAVRKGILVPITTTTCTSQQKSMGLMYAFAHIGFHTAAYSLIQKKDRKSFHLRVGRNLWKYLVGYHNNRDRDNSSVLLLDKSNVLFLVLSQIHQAKSLIEDPNEKKAIATLYLEAGHQCAHSSAFVSAAFHLNCGIELLSSSSSSASSKNCWDPTYYQLCLALHNGAAEMELSIGQMEKANQLIQDVLNHAHQFFPDKIQAYASKIYIEGISNQQTQSIETGIEVLRKLGEVTVPSFPPALFCDTTTRFMLEMRSIRRLLHGKSNQQLLRIPMMMEEEEEEGQQQSQLQKEKNTKNSIQEKQKKMAAMQIMNLMVTSTILVRPNFSSFLQLKWIRITLRYGLSIYASFAFAAYGTLCISIGDIDDGIRFGELALELLDRFQVKAYLPRVYAFLYGSIYIWKEPLRDTIEPLTTAYEVGLQTGDIDFAYMCAGLLAQVKFFSGVPLHHVHLQISGFVKEMQIKKVTTQELFFLPLLHTVRLYIGYQDEPTKTKSKSTSTTNTTTTTTTTTTTITPVDDGGKGSSSAADHYHVVDNNTNSVDDVLGSALQSVVEMKNLTMELLVRFWMISYAYDFGDYTLAGEMAEAVYKAEKQRHPECLAHIMIRFFQALTYIELSRRGGKTKTTHSFHRYYQRKQYMKKAKSLIKFFKFLALHSPHNSLNKQYLLEAEYGSCCLLRSTKAGGNNNNNYYYGNVNKRKGNDRYYYKSSSYVSLGKETCGKYISSIALANDEGLLYEKALANERFGYHLFRMGERVKSVQYFQKACTTYEEWGATGKVKHLQKEMEIMFPPTSSVFLMTLPSGDK